MGSPSANPHPPSLGFAEETIPCNVALMLLTPCPSLGHPEELHIITSAPLREDTEDVIHDVTVAGLDKADAGTETGECRQGRNNTVPDLAGDLGDDALLPGSALTDMRLRIFSEYNKKRENNLTYQDKEMVDLLKEFTITREHSVPSGFWPRNLDVMDATIKLFEAVSDTLKVLLGFVSR